MELGQSDLYDEEGELETARSLVERVLALGDEWTASGLVFERSSFGNVPAGWNCRALLDLFATASPKITFEAALNASLLLVAHRPVNNVDELEAVFESLDSLALNDLVKQAPDMQRLRDVLGANWRAHQEVNETSGITVHELRRRLSARLALLEHVIVEGAGVWRLLPEAEATFCVGAVFDDGTPCVAHVDVTIDASGYVASFFSNTTPRTTEQLSEVCARPWSPRIETFTDVRALHHAVEMFLSSGRALREAHAPPTLATIRELVRMWGLSSKHE